MQRGDDEGMVFDLPSLLEHVRGHYISLLEAELARLQRRNATVIPEFALENDGQICRVDGFAGTRCDALVLSGKTATPTFLPLDRIVTFPRIDFDVDGMPFWISPIHWYGVNATIFGEPGRIMSALVSWFESAFHSTTPNWEQRLKYAVHDVSDIAIEGSRLCCKIDFGTAPASAATDLLDAMRLAGATRVEFGIEK